MWANKLTLLIPEAKGVVSDIGESLSPKYAPEIMAPALNPGLNPKLFPIAIRASPIVPAVDQELPVNKVVIAVMIAALGKNNCGDTICKP